MKKSRTAHTKLCNLKKAGGGKSFPGLFMRRPAYGSLLLTQYAGRAASGGEKIPPARLHRDAYGSLLHTEIYC